MKQALCNRCVLHQALFRNLVTRSSLDTYFGRRGSCPTRGTASCLHIQHLLCEAQEGEANITLLQKLKVRL
jgi:hypothetical protein